ncbi:VOC family protein [Candidatus Roizmanbacteria bacterium]|nr:VOC family protein [Candidatus Roizmanbacteria bacterium]
MKFNNLKPELYVSNFQKSLNFYTNILDFKLEYQRSNLLFAFLSYQGSQIMIQQEDDDEEWHNGKPEYPYGRGINFQIETDNIKNIIDALNKNKYLLKREAKDSWYKVNNTLHGCREILVMDPDGYLLRFSQNIGKKLT